jgi:hypothetical protein
MLQGLRILRLTSVSEPPSIGGPLRPTSAVDLVPAMGNDRHDTRMT